MRSTSKILFGILAVCAAQGPQAFAQPTANQAPPLTKPTDPPLRPGADPTRPSTPPLPPSPDPTPAGNLPDPATPGTPTDPVAPTVLPPPIPGDPPTTGVEAPGSGALVIAGTTHATLGQTDSLSYAWTDDRVQSGIGIAMTLGGGVTGFTDKTMRDTTSSAGGLWDLRVTIGSHLPLALDVSYLGSAMNINGLPAGRNGTLVGTTVEGALRYNILPHAAWNPYVFGGVGWQRYDVTQTTVTLSDSGMNDKDNLLEFPMGAGLSYRMGGFVGDLRGTFRAATDQNLVLKTPAVNPTSNDFAAMHTWEASAAVGYEF